MITPYEDSSISASIQIVTTGFSLAWLFAANLVGLLLAAFLLWPELNGLLQPLTYGRWIPLHLDWQLYGWSFIPLLGLICMRFFDHQKRGAQSIGLCIGLWSFGLLAGGYTWLSGGATGKVFLNWNETSGFIFTTAQLIIWSLLAIAWYERLRCRIALQESTISLSTKAIGLLGLITVPAVLLITSDPTVYPPINPESGGATGHSLLLSTLSLVFLMGLLPRWILKKETLNAKRLKKTALYFWVSYALSMVIFLIIEHGNASNRTFNQVFGLGTLLAWPFLINLYWNSFSWSNQTKYWRWAFIFWWALLAVDGWVIFLPGILDTIKFTNALVAHSHLAMGGMVSALNVIILVEMGSSQRIKNGFSQNLSFLLWSGGCLLYVVTMTLQGWREGQNPQVLFSYDTATAVSYNIRFVAGLLMLTANSLWISQWFKAIRLNKAAEYNSDLLLTETDPLAKHA